jgi:hypothetical protein
MFVCSQHRHDRAIQPCTHHQYGRPRSAFTMGATPSFSSSPFTTTRPTSSASR